MRGSTLTFAALDQLKGIPPLPAKEGDEFPLPAWYRSVYHTLLHDLSVEDLAKACRQKIHLEEIVPLVIDLLKDQPLAGEMFEGELLVSLRSIPSAFWTVHHKENQELRSIIDVIWDGLPEEIRADTKEVQRALG